MANIIRAVAGILRDGNKVLLTSRPENKVYAGNWEFPGGKIEKGENKYQALIRELQEEIGVVANIEDCTTLTQIKQEYTHGLVELDVVVVDNWNGEVLALEGQGLHWQELSQECVLSPLLITTQRILDLLVKPN